MKVLVINAGSSSCKYQLIDMTTETLICSGLVERIGEPAGSITHKIHPNTENEKRIKKDMALPDYVIAIKAVVELLTSKEFGVVTDAREINAIGHRVLLGGEQLTKSVRVTAWAKKIIRENIKLGPLHLPANLACIDVAEELFPHVPAVAVFDTEFHQTMPPKAFMYPLPHELYDDLRIRRYGFHGTSHRYVMKKTAEFLGIPTYRLNMISCHLGSGASICAIEKGKCVDTSMGLTPLEGLMMGTRCGDIDAAILPFLMEQKGYTIDEVYNLMQKKSGMKGICGKNDMRDVLEAQAAGDKKAKLAFEMFCYRIKKYIGAYAAALGRVDALAFTAGIGENCPPMRSEVCSNLQILGMSIDETANCKKSDATRFISKKNAATPVLVVPTNEELEIAYATLEVLGLNVKNHLWL